MGRLLLILLFLLVVIVGLLAAAPFFIPTEVYRTQLIQTVKEATGRDLKLEGEFGISFLPPVSFTATDVSFSNAPWASDEEMLRVKSITASVSVLPFLFSNKVQVNSFVLEDPQIHLEVDANGRGNWEFETASGMADAATAAEPQESPAGSAATQDVAQSGGIDLADVSLGDVRLDNGLVTYRDQKTGEVTRAENINVRVTLPSLDGPLGLDGGLTYQEEALDLDVDVANPRQYIDGTLTAVDARLTSSLINFTFQGDAANRDAGNLPFKGAGSLDLDIPSVRNLAAWAGSPIEGDTGYGPLKLKGVTRAEGDRLIFDNADLSFDEIKATGERFTLDMSRDKPKLTGTLRAGKLDLRPYEGAPADAEDTSPKPVAQTSQQSPDEGWSDEPIDLSALRSIDADLKLTAEEIQTSTLKTGQSEVDVKIDNAVLTLDLREMKLYSGAGKMKTIVDARTDTTRITHQMSFDAIQAAGLVEDFLGTDLVEGGGDFALSFTTQGRSQKDFMGALNGNGSLNFLNGKINGLDLTQIVRTLGDIIKDPQKIQEARSSSGDFLQGAMRGQTDFVEMASTFTIRNGVLNTDDFNLRNVLLSAPGRKGTSLIAQTLDFNLTPEVVGVLESVSGVDLKGLKFPLRVTGTWNNPRVVPDWEKILESAARSGARRLLDRIPGGDDDGGDDPKRQLLEGTADKVLDGLFGGGEKKPDEKDKQDQ